jgi:hypothetical protein
MYRSAEEGNVLQPEDSYTPVAGGAYAAAAAARAAEAEAKAEAEAEAAEEQQAGQQAGQEGEQAEQAEQPSLVQQLAAGQQLLSMLRESQEILADMQRKVGARLGGAPAPAPAKC